MEADGRGFRGSEDRPCVQRSFTVDVSRATGGKRGFGGRWDAGVVRGASDGDRALMVRYADDFVILAKSRKAAERAFKLSEETLASLRLRLHESKTRAVRFSDGFRFLGVIFLKDLLLQPWKPGRKRLRVLSVSGPSLKRRRRAGRRKTAPMSAYLRVACFLAVWLLACSQGGEVALARSIPGIASFS